jgi:hypothetical protein
MKESNIVDMNNHDMVVGIITSRKCPTCEHHEVGYETVDGAFVPLRPGDRIALFPKYPAAGRGNAIQPSSIPVDVEEKERAHWLTWVPEPVRSDRDLCRKYGVLIDRALFKGEMSPGLYEMAYRQKLQRLIKKEAHTPLSVILDRFFAAPHLASGNAKQAADALWAELDEIKAPVTWVTAWLHEKSDASLLKMMHPKTKDEVNSDILGEDQLKEELDSMSLEDFLETL